MINVHDTPKELLLSAVFIQQCEKCIGQKENGKLAIEDVGAEILRLSFSVTFLLDPIFDMITESAMDLEMPREMSIGAGINIGDKWTQEIADTYKEKLWKEFVGLVKQGREIL